MLSTFCSMEFIIGSGQDMSGCPKSHSLALVLTLNQINHIFLLKLYFLERFGSIEVYPESQIPQVTIYQVPVLIDKFSLLISLHFFYSFSWENRLKYQGKFPFGDHFIHSHNLFPGLCFDILRRNLILVTLGAERVN